MPVLPNDWRAGPIAFRDLLMATVLHNVTFGLGESFEDLPSDGRLMTISREPGDVFLYKVDD
jgi:hypothetical protein